MNLQELLAKDEKTGSIECWDDESTAAALESVGVDRSHQAVYQWTHRVAEEAPDPPTA